MRRVIEQKIKWALEILRGYNIECEVNVNEFFTYITAPTITGDITTVEEIIDNDLLILHEIAEICKFKELGIPITKDIFLEYSNLAYRIHLLAMEIELDHALKTNRSRWIEKRLHDIQSYLNDPNMPSDLRNKCIELLRRFSLKH